MKILVINCGSSSLKYQFMDMENEEVIAKGLAERIGIEGSVLKHQPKGFDKVTIERPMPTHKEALQAVVDALKDKDYGVIKDMGEIAAVGHRVVHAGEKFAYSVLLKEEVMSALKECIEIAPLHNPPNIMGIEACKQIMPNVPMVGVFDTAFHQTMPKEIFLYPVPMEWYENFGVRKYGFHGTSHKYISEFITEKLGYNPKLINCHIGNGISVCAIKDGKSIDTSMGLTPLEGVMMGTRSGNVDPGMIPFIMSKTGKSAEEVVNELNKNSGIQAVSGISNDLRDVEESMLEGDERSTLAIEMYANRIVNYISMYNTLLEGMEVLVFTAGVGENSDIIREKIVDKLKCLGLELDKNINKGLRSEFRKISTPNSKVEIYIAPTDEEIMIAKDTFNLVG